MSELTAWNEDAATELADCLVEFDDDMCAPCRTHTATRLTPPTPSSNRHPNRFDANYWAIHQEDPTPVLTDEEKQGYDLLEVLTVEFESLRFTQRRNGSLPAADTTVFL